MEMIVTKVLMIVKSVVDCDQRWMQEDEKVIVK